MRILIVDDDPLNSRMMHFLLSEQGYQVETVDSARGAVAMIERQPPDLMLLDVMLPQLNGFQFYHRLRERDFDFPVIFVTGKDDLEDRLQGLNMGADDYICKPFDPAELTARVAAVLRRFHRAISGGQQHIHSGPLDIDVAARQVTLPGRRAVQLTPTELLVLLQLVRRAGEAVSREELMAAVWGEHYAGGSNVVDVYIRRLRRKLEADPTSPTIIQSARGIGYRFMGA